MADGDLDDVLAEYDAATTDVMSANSSTFETNLERWFELIDETPALARLARTLESKVDFQRWHSQGTSSMSSMVGSAELRWPRVTSVNVVEFSGIVGAAMVKRPSV